jgi:UDP-perosamine 4-acetyltransferase
VSQCFIFGAGGHARSLAVLTKADVTFVVAGEPQAHEISEAEFFERLEEYRKVPVYLGIGSDRIRRAVFERLRGYGCAPAILVAPTAFVARNAELHAGTTIMAGAVVGANAVIGENCIVNTLSSVDHDCRLGAHTQVTVGVTLAGNVSTGEQCFFGTKSAAIPQCTLGRNVAVMAGGVVTESFGDDVVVGGVPARVVKAREPLS